MDEQKINAMVVVAEEVAKDAYNNVACPVLKPTGGILGLIPRAIRVALLPMEKWIVGKEYNLAEIMKLLAVKLEKVAPEAHIGISALQYMSYCIDSDELRDMYASLINYPTIKLLRAKYATHNGEQAIRIDEGYCRMTEFGHSFKAICITPKV